MTSTTQADYWNTQAAERWVSEQPRLDRFLAPLLEAGLERAAPKTGESVLDVGCGCGASSLALADAVGPSGAVLGVDISGPMLALAGERAAGHPNLTFMQADAGTQELAPDRDLLFSRFGVMFFEEPAAAFRNLHATLKPSGRACFLCWRGIDDNAWMRVPKQIAARFVEPSPPPDPDAPGPMALAREDRLLEVLTSAGFRDIALHQHDTEVALSTTGVAEAVDFSIRGGPLARVLDGANQSALTSVYDALHAEFAKHCEGERVALGASVWIVTARA